MEERKREASKREKASKIEKNQDRAHESEKNELKRKRDTARIEVNLWAQKIASHEYWRKTRSQHK